MRFTLIQIQSIVEIHRQRFHVSKAAQSLNTSQSVISKHLKSLEGALAGKIFTRSGKRLTGLTDLGENILKYAQRMIHDHESIERIAREADASEREVLSLATTPTLARYLIADTVKTFTLAHPDVQLRVQVEESDKAVEAVQLQKCDFAIVPIARNMPSGLSVSVLAAWSRLLIGLPDCTLFTPKKITLDAIAREPIIAFETPTVSLQDVFKQHGLLPKIAVTTSNPEVMKAYASIGLGVAVVAAATFDETRDAPLISRNVSDLFPSVQIGSVQLADSYNSFMQIRFLTYLKANLATHDQ